MNILDIFAGIGGLSFSFHKDKNFKVLGMNEILKDPCETYALNNPETEIFNMDIREFGKDIFNKKIDLVLGGPPCQSYSTSGKRDLKDSRSFLYKEYIRILQEYSPEVFVFENVTGLLTMNRGKLFKEILNNFKNIGYNVFYEIIDCLNYGIPQQRKRVIVIGYKNKKKCFKLKKTTKRNILSLKDALSDIPLEGSNNYIHDPQNSFQRAMRKNNNLLMDHEPSNHGKKLIKIMENLKQGETLKDIPEKIRPKKAFGNSYSRLWWNRPSYTITRNFGTPSSARCIHPLVNRALTTREGARLQTFPDSFTFSGSRSSKNLQIGEAVPPFLSKVIKKSLCYNL